MQNTLMYIIVYILGAKSEVASVHTFCQSEIDQAHRISLP